MPRAKICREPGCDALIRETETYCDKHAKPKPKPFANASRSNSTLYNTHRWRVLRGKILDGNPCCHRCGASQDGHVLEVHHITPPRGDETLFFDLDNLVPVCRQCHRAATGREIGGRRRDR